jgi:hypothetical protein
VALTARLEAAPFQNKIKTGVFQQTVKPGFILRHLWRGWKPRHFKTKSKTPQAVVAAPLQETDKMGFTVC